MSLRPIRTRSVLRRLRIENLVLIREADLEPGSGLNAITGETGAGKTILAAVHLDTVTRKGCALPRDVREKASTLIAASHP